MGRGGNDFSFGMGLGNVDIYRKMPTDLSETTKTGQAFSVAAIVFALYLFASEFAQFMTSKDHSELMVNTMSPDIAEQDITVYLNITLPALPCSLLGISFVARDQQMANHHNRFVKELRRTRLHADGSFKADAATDKHTKIMEMHDKIENAGKEVKFNPEMTEDLQRLESIKERYQKVFADHITSLAHIEREGCNIVGNMSVPRVPGTIEISSKAFASVIDLMEERLANENSTLSHIDMTHHIHTWQFHHPAVTEDEIAKDTTPQPLTNLYRDAHIDLQSFEYFLQLVSVEDRTKRIAKKFFQYSAAEQSLVSPTHRDQTILFRYEVSPITVQKSNGSQPFFSFLTNLCAIIGGVVTTMGVLNSVFGFSRDVLMKKMRMNKLL